MPGYRKDSRETGRHVSIHFPDILSIHYRRIPSPLGCDRPRRDRDIGTAKGSAGQRILGYSVLLPAGPCRCRRQRPIANPSAHRRPDCASGSRVPIHAIDGAEYCRPPARHPQEQSIPPVDGARSKPCARDERGNASSAAGQGTFTLRGLAGGGAHAPRHDAAPDDHLERSAGRQSVRLQQPDTVHGTFPRTIRMPAVTGTMTPAGLPPFSRGAPTTGAIHFLRTPRRA